MLASFKRYLDGKNYGHCLITSPDFVKTRNALSTKQKVLKSFGKGDKPNAARSLTDDELIIMYDKNIMGNAGPGSLINALWWNNCNYFGMRGCQEHRDMRWGDIKLKRRIDSTEYLEYTERQTKTRQGDKPGNTRAIKPTMWTGGWFLECRRHQQPCTCISVQVVCGEKTS